MVLKLYCLRIDTYWLGIQSVDYLPSFYKEALGSIPRTIWHRIIFTKELKMCSSGNTSFMTLLCPQFLLTQLVSMGLFC